MTVEFTTRHNLCQHLWPLSHFKSLGWLKSDLNHILLSVSQNLYFFPIKSRISSCFEEKLKKTDCINVQQTLKHHPKWQNPYIIRFSSFHICLNTWIVIFYKFCTFSKAPHSISNQNSEQKKTHRKIFVKHISKMQVFPLWWNGQKFSVIILYKYTVREDPTVSVVYFSRWSLGFVSLNWYKLEKCLCDGITGGQVNPCYFFFIYNPSHTLSPLPLKYYFILNFFYVNFKDFIFYQ